MNNFNPDGEHKVKIRSGHVYLDGILAIPTDACGLVLFVHGTNY